MKRNRFLKILSLGAIAAPVAGSAVLQGLQALTEHKPSDQLLLDSIQSLINSPSDPGTYTVWTGKEGMKAFDEAMKEMAEFTKEQEYKMMYGITT